MTVIAMFLKVIIVIFILHVLLLVIQFCIAGSIAGKNPFRLLKNMLPAYATALGTQSSAATIPVTLAQTLKNGVRENIAIFVIPLCATIHLAGSTMKITACAMAVMLMLMHTVIEFALLCEFKYFREIMSNLSAFHINGSKTLNSWGIDNIPSTF